MKNISAFFCTPLLFLSLFFVCGTHAGDEITIIRNAGGTALVKNSLVSITLGVSQGADYLELPIHMSADDQLLIFSDTTLNRLTDVADLFPTRHRADGNYYVVDFSLAELRLLRLRDVVEPESSSLFVTIPTLREGLMLTAKLNAILGKNTGVVIGLQDPAFYTSEGKDISGILRQLLDQLSYDPEDKIFLQSADPDELQKISRWPVAAEDKTFSLIQMIETKDNTNDRQIDIDIPQYQHEWLFTNSGLRILASYAAVVAFPAEVIEKNNPMVDNAIDTLRQYGIKIFRQSSTDTTAIDRQQSFAEAGSPVTGAAERQSYFDGVYLDYLSETADPMKNPAPASAEDSKTSTPSSTLPPFFSNLGLSSPNNSQHNDETNGDETAR